jgi:diguanylate cyclase (GGDEF)-like protein/PAS domain S-box-containing protein
MKLSEAWFHSRRSLIEWSWIGLVLLTFAGYVVFSAYEDHARIEALQQERLTHQLAIVAANLNRQFNSTNLALANVLREIPKWRQQKDGGPLTSRHLKALSDAMPGVITMMVIDAKGTVVASDKPELAGTDVAQREYFQSVRRSPNPATLFVSPPFMTSRGNFTINLSRMIPGRDNSFDGMVVAALDPEEFKDLLESALYAQNMSASLIHGDGAIFLSVPATKDELVGFDLRKPGSLMSRHMHSGRQTNVFKGNIKAQSGESMVALMTMQTEAIGMDKPFVIAVGRDTQAMFATWKRNIVRNAAIFGIFALCAILGMFYYQERRRAHDRASADQEAERERAVEALRVSEERFRSLIKLSSDWYWEQDDQFRFIRLDGELDQRTSLVNEAHIGKTRWELGATNLTEADWERHRAILQRRQVFCDFEMLRRDKTGNPYWVSISGAPIFDAQKKFCGYRGVARDISTQKFADDRVKNLAFHDSLTQLPNRRLFDDRLGHAITASKRSEHYGALIFLDLDNFKPINDSHGHAAGDLLLVEVAHRIANCVREVDTVARFGGDEFAVILSELDTEMPAAKKQGTQVAEKIRASLAEPYSIKLIKDGVEIALTHNCTASIGVVFFLGNRVNQEELLKRADFAMYQAKEYGRNLIRFSEHGESTWIL